MGKKVELIKPTNRVSLLEENKNDTRLHNVDTFEVWITVNDIFYSVCFLCLCSWRTNGFPGALSTHHTQQQLRMALSPLESYQAPDTWHKHRLPAAQHHAATSLSAVYTIHSD